MLTRDILLGAYSGGERRPGEPFPAGNANRMLDTCHSCLLIIPVFSKGHMQLAFKGRTVGVLGSI
jgi:hypothetical protein